MANGAISICQLLTTRVHEYTSRHTKLKAIILGVEYILKNFIISCNFFILKLKKLWKVVEVKFLGCLFWRIHYTVLKYEQKKIRKERKGYEKKEKEIFSCS